MTIYVTGHVIGHWDHGHRTIFNVRWFKCKAQGNTSDPFENHRQEFVKQHEKQCRQKGGPRWEMELLSELSNAKVIQTNENDGGGDEGGSRAKYN